MALHPMAPRPTLPFRDDNVGSFLRPAYLLQARQQFFMAKAITAEPLRTVQDRAIAEIVRFQLED